MSTPLERRIAQHMPAIMELVAHWWSGEELERFAGLCGGDAVEKFGADTALMAEYLQDTTRELIEDFIRQIANHKPLTNPAAERRKVAANERNARKLLREIKSLHFQLYPDPYQAATDALAKLIDELPREQYWAIDRYTSNTRTTKDAQRLQLAANMAHSLLETDEEQTRRCTMGAAPSSRARAAKLYKEGRFVRITQLLVKAATGKEPSGQNAYITCRKLLRLMPRE